MLSGSRALWFNLGVTGLGWWLSTSRSSMVKYAGFGIGFFGAYHTYQTYRNLNSSLSGCTTCTPPNW